jgi:hypothetical protein
VGLDTRQKGLIKTMIDGIQNLWACFVKGHNLTTQAHKYWVGLGTGRFGRVSARSATRPVPLGFGQIQPAMNSKTALPVGYLGRTGRGCAGGLVGLVGRVGYF